ncbi:zinc finger protein 431-like [Pseudochaenichthys georgianus]|uniref:zinc finger protein 431-like n=1 Tax=Pseudochaenichthys georgianus TaxID=52239 RepID=UPI00146F41C1|nr:zinc finger protein 2-like [Pseudochaenichthys georgianus]
MSMAVIMAVCIFLFVCYCIKRTFAIEATFEFYFEMYLPSLLPFPESLRLSDLRFCFCRLLTLNANMSENLVFYSEIKSILETVIRTSVDIGHSKEKTSTKGATMRREPDFDTVVEMLAREATRKIDAVFSQLSSTLHNENQTLQARVGGLQSELKTTQENFENARMWREHVLSGSPVLFQQSGLVYTLKPSGKLKTRTDQLTGDGPETGHDEAAKEVNSEAESSAAIGQDIKEDSSTTNTADSKTPESQNTQEAGVRGKGKQFVCEVCTKSFSRQFHLMKHRNTHREQRPFSCDQCPRRFRNTETFEYHLLRHEERKYATLKCPLCEKMFKTQMHLKTHQMVHTDTRPFTCSTCEKAFKTKHSLQAHQVVHSAEKPHKCSECGEGFRYAFTLQCHQSIHTGEHPFKCTVCGKAFIKRRSLSAHQRGHRGKMFTCETCGAGFTLQHNLRRHVRIHTGEKPFKCKVCGKSFIQDNRLKSHMLLHGASKSFMCDLCGKTFLYNCQLQKHQKATHDERHGQVVRRRTREKGNRRVIYRRDRTSVDVTPFSCKTCRKGLDSAGALRRHEQIHTGQRQHTCPTCGKSFFYKATYDYHQRIHTGERPFGCDVCGKRFIIPQALKSHKLQHSGEKPHQCEQCDKAFRIYTNLLRHMRVHTGEKPYECEVCGVRFRQLGHVKFHMQVHTGERPYSCSSCGLGFSDSRLLKRHNCAEKHQNTSEDTLATS